MRLEYPGPTLLDDKVYWSNPARDKILFFWISLMYKSEICSTICVALNSATRFRPACPRR